MSYTKSILSLEPDGGLFQGSFGEAIVRVCVFLDIAPKNLMGAGRSCGVVGLHFREWVVGGRRATMHPIASLVPL